jgi:ribonucleoside-diphosphate reductase alpha chain
MTYEDEKDQLLGNPCFEISLRAFSFCNLSEFIIPRLKTFEEYKEAAEAATFFGTLQAGFTDFKYLRPIWKQNTEMDALLGVSMTGQAQAWDRPWFNSESKYEVAKHCVSVNKKYAKIIGINPAKRVTTTKPSGSTSAAMGNSSGVHAEWPFVLRKILIDKKSNLGIYLKDKLKLDKVVLNKNKNLMEQSLAKENCWVLNLPLKYENTIDKDKESAIEFLNRIKDTHDSWINGGHVEGSESHNCSATCYYHEHEIEDIKKWLWENKDSYRGMAFFRHGDYQMIEMPFTKITKKQYEEMSSNIPDVDVFDVVLEEINKGETVACAGGSCEIKTL